MSNESGYFAPLPNSLEREISSLKDRISKLESDKSFLQGKVRELSKMCEEGHVAFRKLRSENEDYKMQLAELQGMVWVKDDALEFYADPGQYHAIMIVGDPPCGGFIDDFDTEHGDPFFDRPMPGKTARKALECTPKNLPKLVTEEEHQKALEAIDMLQSELGKQQEEYLRVKEEYESERKKRQDEYLDLYLRLAGTEDYLRGMRQQFIIDKNKLKSHAEAMANAHDLESVCFTTAAYRKDFPGPASPLSGINEAYRKDFPK